MTEETCFQHHHMYNEHKNDIAYKENIFKILDFVLGKDIFFLFFNR